MKVFLSMYWPTILVMVLFLVYVIYHVVTRQWGELRATAYKLMLAAEKVMVTDSGQVKFEFVFDRAYNLIPPWLQLFVTRSLLKEKLQLYNYPQKVYKKNKLFEA